MGQEINLMINYPRTKRDVRSRGSEKTDADRALACEFGKDFFDGDRRNGYGGFNYNERVWKDVVPSFQQHYGLTGVSTLLDVGCAKGFMISDFARDIPGIDVRGVDISEYAIQQAKHDVSDRVSVANAIDLPFEDSSFDLVISITTIHNLEGDDLVAALREIMRVSRGGAFITVDAYRNDEEKKAMFAWNLRRRPFFMWMSGKRYLIRLAILVITTGLCPRGGIGPFRKTN